MPYGIYRTGGAYANGVISIDLFVALSAGTLTQSSRM